MPPVNTPPVHHDLIPQYSAFLYAIDLIRRSFNKITEAATSLAQATWNDFLRLCRWT